LAVGTRSIAISGGVHHIMTSLESVAVRQTAGQTVTSASLGEQLKTFRRTHPYCEIGVPGNRWRYMVCGKGEHTLLLPAGGTRLPDMYLLLVQALEPDFRIVLPTYPPLPTMAGLVDGLAGILDAERLTQVDVLGSSFGGFVAQCFVRKHSDRVRRLILANTGAPGISPLPALGLLIQLFARMPEGLVRWGTGRNWRRWFVAPPEQQTFWRGLLDELLATQLTKADLVQALAEMQDYTTNYRFSPEDLASWPGRILLIESAHDEAFSPAARAALRALYPRAQVRTFVGGGHAVMVCQPAEYVTAVRAFLEEQ
jgi:pimeloyl-ACP methyl ester carboxylesterase